MTPRRPRTRHSHSKIATGDSESTPARAKPPLIALSVTSEIFPLIKTGGLADVAGALPIALRQQGIEMHSLVPAYPGLVDKLSSAQPCWSDPEFFGGPARLLAGTFGDLALFALDAPHLYARPGGPYNDPSGRDWPDNPRRFAALSYCAFLLARGVLPGFTPQLIHAHDWQTGLAPAYLALAGGKRPASVFTVHNLAFQGWAPPNLLAELALPAHAFAMDGLEFYGGIGLLKAGLYYADRITTVSPSYAAEIRTPAWGEGLDGLLNARSAQLSGILNGIDTQTWDPARDPCLPAPFGPGQLAPRMVSKANLQCWLGLAPDPARLLLGVVSRLSHQKGLDLLLDSLGALDVIGAQLALLGSGDPALQAAFLAAAAARPGQIGVQLGYDEATAHLIQAGSDAILVPSRFEPCGLTQLCALRYGALPVVSRVGGLADTVIDANPAARAAGVATGVQFAPVTPSGLRGALSRLAELWTDPTEWARMQSNGMAQDVGWTVPAKQYATLYREVLAANP